MQPFESRQIDKLQTPAAIIDKAILQRNALRMISRTRDLGLRLRPHVKTHKTVQGALIQTSAPDRPITVSTMAEAAWFARAGFQDITWAFPVTAQRINDVLQMSKRIRRFGVVTDDERMVSLLDEAARGQSVQISVLLKVDVGANRAGVDVTSERALNAARQLAKAPHLRFEGLLGHEGQSYGVRGGPDAFRSVATFAARQMQVLVQRCEDIGIQIDEVSLGSTPTATYAEHLPGVTELRPGNYLLLDMTQVALGTCRVQDISFSVLTTVIGRYPERGVIIVDAGALALSMDPGVLSAARPPTYGHIAQINGTPITTPIHIDHLSQEHGIILIKDEPILKNVRVGDILQVLPNHSCLAAALFPAYFIQDGEAIIDRWIPARGWNLSSEI